MADQDTIMTDQETLQPPTKVELTGSCFCRYLLYTLYLPSKDDARTSLCHCRSCKKAFGGAFGLTIKVPLATFRYKGEGKPTVSIPTCKSLQAVEMREAMKGRWENVQVCEKWDYTDVHVGENGSGNNVYREFCHKCGSYICEYGEQAKAHFRYVTLGSLDHPTALPPKGEFFCSQREAWMPTIPGTACFWKL